MIARPVGRDVEVLAVRAGRRAPMGHTVDTLGPDFRFETPVYRRGEVAGDELRGDLILVAVGDLTMGGRDKPDGTIAFTGLDHAESNALPGATLTDTYPLAGLDDLARQVAAAGIRRVSGDVLVDARMFDQTPKDDYVLSPIMINDNLVDLTVTPAAVGAPATVTSRPATAAFQVRATVTTVAAEQLGNAGYRASRSGRGTVVAAYVMHTPIGATEEVFAVAQDVGAVVAALWEAT